MDKYRPFWRWVREISEAVIQKEEKSFEYIAYSNLLKCQARRHELDDSEFELNKKLAKNCMEKIGWIFQEIETLAPKNIIIFASRKKNYFLGKLLLEKLGLNDMDTISKMEKKGIVFLKVDDKNIIISRHPQGTANDLKEKLISYLKSV